MLTEILYSVFKEAEKKDGMVNFKYRIQEDGTEYLEVQTQKFTAYLVSNNKVCHATIDKLDWTFKIKPLEFSSLVEKATENIARDHDLKSLIL